MIERKTPTLGRGVILQAILDGLACLSLAEANTRQPETKEGEGCRCGDTSGRSGAIN